MLCKFMHADLRVQKVRVIGVYVDCSFCNCSKSSPWSFFIYQCTVEYSRQRESLRGEFVCWFYNRKTMRHLTLWLLVIYCWLYMCHYMHIRFTPSKEEGKEGRVRLKYISYCIMFTLHVIWFMVLYYVYITCILKVH